MAPRLLQDNTGEQAELESRPQYFEGFKSKSLPPQRPDHSHFPRSNPEMGTTSSNLSKTWHRQPLVSVSQGPGCLGRVIPTSRKDGPFAVPVHFQPIRTKHRECRCPSPAPEPLAFEAEPSCQTQDLRAQSWSRPSCCGHNLAIESTDTVGHFENVLGPQRQAPITRRHTQLRGSVRCSCCLSATTIERWNARSP